MKVKVKYKLEFIIDSWSNHDAVWLLVKFPKTFFYQDKIILRLANENFSTTGNVRVFSYEEGKQMLTPDFILNAIKGMVKEYYKDKRVEMSMCDSRAEITKQIKQFKGIIEVDINES
jgi:hypothetical protein